MEKKGIQMRLTKKSAIKVLTKDMRFADEFQRYAQNKGDPEITTIDGYQILIRPKGDLIKPWIMMNLERIASFGVMTEVIELENEGES